MDAFLSKNDDTRSFSEVNVSLSSLDTLFSLQNLKSNNPKSKLDKRENLFATDSCSENFLESTDINLNKIPRKISNGNLQNGGSNFLDLNVDPDDSQSLIANHSEKFRISDEREMSHYRRSRISKSRRTKCFFVFCILSSILILILLFGLGVHYYSVGIRNYIQLFITSRTFKNEFEGCTQIEASDIWVKIFPMKFSEGPIRLIDSNKDKILDPVIPYGTNTCNLFSESSDRCFGGLLALDGKTGETIWDYKASGEIYSLICEFDLDFDGIIDCLGAGLLGTFAAISGKSGEEIWYFDLDQEESPLNFYTPQFIPDVDQDGIPDLIQLYGSGQPSRTLIKTKSAQLKLFSGRTGQVLYSQVVPDSSVAQSSPIMISLGDRMPAIIFGTGSETQSGTMFVVRLDDFIEGRLAHKSHSIFRGSDGKGVINPPLLADLNGDKSPDLISCPYNDGCFAFDPKNNFKPLWTYLANSSLIFSMPALGYFNQDSIPDVFVELNYQADSNAFTQASILDGRNGEELKVVHLSQGSITASPLVVSMEGFGNDIFLFWSQKCEGQNKIDSFIPKRSNPASYWSIDNICVKKFNTSLVLELRAFSRTFKQPDVLVYSSKNDFKDEHSKSTFPNSKLNIQQALSTGTLAPPIVNSEDSTDGQSNSVDIIFATFWIEKSNQDDLKSNEFFNFDNCVEKWLNKENDLTNRRDNKYYKMDRSSYQRMVHKKCEQLSQSYQESDNIINESRDKQSQLTIYRKRMQCKCDPSANKKCTKPLSFSKQSWAQYLGLNATRTFRPVY